MTTLTTPDQVLWRATQGNRSLLRQTLQTGTQPTIESYNAAGLNLYKFSPLQSKFVDLVPGEGADIDLVYVDEKVQNKPRGSIKKFTLKDSAGPVENNKKIIEFFESNKYRTDMKDFILAKYTKLYKAIQKQKNSKK